MTADRNDIPVLLKDTPVGHLQRAIRNAAKPLTPIETSLILVPERLRQRPQQGRVWFRLSPDAQRETHDFFFGSEVRSGACQR